MHWIRLENIITEGEDSATDVEDVATEKETCINRRQRFGNVEGRLRYRGARCSNRGRNKYQKETKM